MLLFFKLRLTIHSKLPIATPADKKYTNYLHFHAVHVYYSKLTGMTETIMKKSSTRAGRNRTLTLTEVEKKQYTKQLIFPARKMRLSRFQDKILCGDFLQIIDFLPDAFVNLLILDPPYTVLLTAPLRTTL